MKTYGRTPLHIAVRSGSLADVSSFCKSAEAADLDVTDDFGFTALYTACIYGHVDMMQVLVEAGCDIGKADLGGLTPLHIAAEKGQAAAVAYLLSCGADRNVPDTIGRTALDWANAKGHVAVVDVLAK